MEPPDPDLGELPHDIVEFMQQVLDELQSEYSRIRSRTAEDPGTAGDEGESNWAEVLRNWLPSTYHVVTKGRILTSLGEASPQLDLLVLNPNYPRKLLGKKHYLSSGVLAAFECKNTLRRSGIQQAIENSKSIAEMLLHERETKGYWICTPPSDRAYAELHKPIVYGLLAHSHSWAPDDALSTISQILDEVDASVTTHPRELIDIVCIADLAVWSAGRCANSIYVKNGFSGMTPECTTTFTCLHRAMWHEKSIHFKSFTTIGALLSRLYEKLSHIDPQSLMFANYLRLATKDGQSGGRPFRKWGDILSAAARSNILATRDPREWVGYW